MGLEAQPGRRGSWGTGVLADLFWSLIRWPRIPSPERKGGMGSRGMQQLGASGPLAGLGQGGVGFLGTRGPGYWGCQRWAGRDQKCNRNSQPVVTFPSVPSCLGLALGESTSKAKRLRWVKTSQAPPVSKANQSPGAQAEEGPGWEEPGQLDSTSTALPPGPSDPPLGWLLPSQRWVGA